MYTFLITIHILISIFLVLSILMQSSKGGALSGTFGGSSGGALFGGRGGATFLSRVTTGLTIAFFTISLFISLLSIPKGTTESIIKKEADRRVAPAADLPVPQGTMPQQAGVPQNNQQSQIPE